MTTILTIVAEELELVIISNDTSLLVGDTALLVCVGYGIPDLDIIWSANGEVVQNSSIVTIYEEEVLQGGKLFKQSFLQLCSLATSHSGVYTCSVNNGPSVINATTQLSVSGRNTFYPCIHNII